MRYRSPSQALLKTDRRVYVCEMDRLGAAPETLEISKGSVCFGSIADVHSRASAAKMAAVFSDGLLPWPKHFSPKTFGRL